MLRSYNKIPKAVSRLHNIAHTTSYQRGALLIQHETRDRNVAYTTRCQGTYVTHRARYQRGRKSLIQSRYQRPYIAHTTRFQKSYIAHITRHQVFRRLYNTMPAVVRRVYTRFPFFDSPLFSYFWERLRMIGVEARAAHYRIAPNEVIIRKIVCI